jgi:GDPmannose 4,6-dehydratase
MKKKILILGITGQIGSYLADILLECGHEIHGMIRRSSVTPLNTDRINHIYEKLHLHYGDITDALSVDQILFNVKPDYIFNMAAQSHVQVSFSTPLYTAITDGVGPLLVLEAMKKHCPRAKYIQASTSELYGDVLEIPQTEKTKFNPVSPYAVAKMYGFYITKVYREAYDLFACNSICFNNESERRGSTFITKKITEALSQIYYKIENNENFKTLKIGNLNSERDWGYSYEYAQGMIKIIEHSEPDDYVLATGEKHSVREFIEEASQYVGMNIEWSGEGINEKSIDKKTGKVIIEIDEKYFRPLEVNLLLGDAKKIKAILGWEPKVKFKELVKIMMENDLKRYEI